MKPRHRLGLGLAAVLVAGGTFGAIIAHHLSEPAGRLVPLGTVQRGQPQPDGKPRTLPDPKLTPGDVLTTDTDAVCQPGYASSVRSVTGSVRDQAYAAYGIKTHAPGQYEVDHLIPLELGGSNDLTNLWPEAAEPKPGFHQKDLLENRLHSLVCQGALSIETAQREIARDWVNAYRMFMGGLP